MHKVEQIHQHIHSTACNSLKKQLNTLLTTIGYNSTVLLFINLNNNTLYIPLEYGEYETLWTDALIGSQAPLYSRTSKLRLPQNAFSADIYIYTLNYQDYINSSFISKMSGDTHTMFNPWGYHRYQINGDIISLYLVLKKRCISQYILNMKANLDHILDTIYREASKNPKYIETFNVTRSLAFCDVVDNDLYQLDIAIISSLQLNNSELKILKIIYSGVYKNKEIAYYSSLSVRTVEGVITNLKRKLSCQNKEELIVKIHTLHSVIRNSILNQLQLK